MNSSHPFPLHETPPQESVLFFQMLDEFRQELDTAHASHRRLLRLLEQLSRYLARIQPRGASVLGAPPQPQIRQPILTLLGNAPEGLTRKEIETALQSPKRLSYTLQGMYREGLVVRLRPGVYGLPPGS
jgi:hypothetical protein